jgi:hypothetical protein
MLDRIATMICTAKSFILFVLNKLDLLKKSFQEHKNIILRKFLYEFYFKISLSAATPRHPILRSFTTASSIFKFRRHRVIQCGRMDGRSWAVETSEIQPSQPSQYTPISSRSVYPVHDNFYLATSSCSSSDRDRTPLLLLCWVYS